MKLHPNAPEALRRKYHKLKSFHKLAAELDVNVSYLHDLLRYGIEPTNPAIRKKLGLKNLPFSRLDLGDRRRKHIRWFESLPRTGRSRKILQLYNHREEDK